MTNFEVTLHIPPGELAINRAYRKHAKGVRLNEAFRQARTACVRDVRDAWNREPIEGPVSVQLDYYWPHDVGDIDGPDKAVLDVLQKARVYQNDLQVVKKTTQKHVDPANPRIVIKVDLQ
jgi:Holliday junction resolvase RusA-like endonuclease